MLGKLVKIIQLTIFILVASCLPQEKTTQCGAGEAYNATQRRCVATAVSSTKSITITSVSPTSSYALSASDPSVTHSIVVSDPFNLGYTIKWNLKQPNGSTLLVGTGLSYTFVHTAFTSGSYILEAQVFDSAGSTYLDSRSWTINLMTETVPSITAITPNPFATTTTSAATTIQATLSNPDALSGVVYKWFVNGTVTTDTGTFSSTSVSESFTFDPTSAASYHAGAGTYAVQLVLQTASGIQYDSYIWTVQNNLPGFTTVSLGDDINGNTTPSTASLFVIIDEFDFNPAGDGGIRYNHSSISSGALDKADVCIKVAEFAGVDGDGVAVDFLMNGVAIPNANALTYTSDNQTICLGQSINAAGGSYNIDIPSTIQVESRTITAVVYDKYAGVTTQPKYNGGAEIARYNWTARVRQQNAAPIVTINYATTNFGAYDCSSKSSTSWSGCEIKQDTNLTVAITVNDDADGDGVVDYNASSDPDDEHFKVDFFIDNQDMDGTHPTYVVDEDCTRTYSDGTTAATRYVCTLQINSYDSNGPVEPAGKTYRISAKVKDDGSPYQAIAAESSYSNEVTWDISTVNYATDTISITAFGNTLATDSTIVDANSTSTIVNGGGTTMEENDVVHFNVKVYDPQHDSHNIKIYRCLNGLACTTTKLVSTKLVNSAGNTFDFTTHISTSVIAHQISQDAVTSANNANVYYKVLVEGYTGQATEQTDATDSVTKPHPYISINNYNPDPVLTGNYTPALNTVGTALVSYAGVPVTIDSGTVTDTSLSDGATIKYQWMISTNGGTTYEAISGATDKNLIWSPGSEIDSDTNPTGNDTRIILCIGDDGWDNANTQAKTPQLNAGSTGCLNQGSMQGGPWYFKTFSNMYRGSAIADGTAANTSSGEVAVWIDPSTKAPIVKYTAYVNQNKEIVVEKFVTTATTGVKGGSVEQSSEEISYISFPASTDPFYGGYDVTNLSMTGDATNKALYISYMAPVSGVDIVHVRRIDIRTGKTGYIHGGTFGWDKGYDDLTDNFNPGNGLTESINSNGQLQITVTQPADTATNMQLEMFGATSSNSTVLRAGAGNQFCTGTCASTTATATEIAAAINAATGDGFQGVVASSSGAVVTLSGIYEDDYIQMDIGATQIGQIMVNKTQGQWVLPFIDHDQTGSDKHKLSIFYGNLNTRLTDSNPLVTFLNSGTGISAAEEIANDIYETDPDGDGTSTGNDRYIIATRTKTTGEIALYEFSAANALIESNLDLFSDTNVTNIKFKISQNSTNQAAYLVGRNNSNALAYARLAHTGGNFDINANVPTLNSSINLDLDNAFDLIEDTTDAYYDIAPGAQQYQLFVAVAYHPDNTTYEGYLATISGGTPVIDCSYASDQALTKCMKLTSNSVANTVDSVFNLPVALGDVLEDVTIGNAGATSGENINDMLPVVFQIDDGGNVPASDAIPITGLLNVSSINVSGDENSMGQVHNLPYVND